MLNQVDKVIALAKIAHTFCKNGEEWYRVDSVEDVANDGFFATNEEDLRSYFFTFDSVDLSKDKFYELNVIEPSLALACIADVKYLRTRNRHTPELEQQLIALHKAGTPPNMCEFGCTKETGEALLKAAMKIQDDVINQAVSGTRSNTDGSISTL